MENLKKKISDKLSKAKRTALLAVGSELRGDDAAGILVARALGKAPRKKWKHTFKVFFGETAPENLTGEIIKFKPSLLILLDTVQVGKRAGKVLFLDPEDIGNGISFSTHKLPVRVLLDYLRTSLQCEIIIIGIQAKDIGFGRPVSKPVLKAVKEVTQVIRSSLS